MNMVMAMDKNVKNEIGKVFVQILQSEPGNQKDLGITMGVNQSNVSRLKKGKFLSFSLERILQLINRCGYDTKVFVKPSDKQFGDTECFLILKDAVLE